MAGVNKVILVGNVGRDAELRFTQGGTPIANFSLATSENYTDKASGQKQEKTEWHNVICWGRLAEIASEYVKKGRQVYCEGKLQTRDWTDPQGVRHFKTEVVCHTLQLLGGKPNSQQSGNGQPAAPAQQHDDYDIGDLGAPIDMDDDALSAGLSPGD